MSNVCPSYGKSAGRLPDVVAPAHGGREPLLGDRDHAGAEPLLRECWEIRQKREPDSWKTFHAQSMLGEALLGQKKYADAEPLLLAGYRGMKRHEAGIAPEDKVYLGQALKRLVDLYDALDMKDSAAGWRKELEAFRQAEEKSG